MARGGCLARAVHDRSQLLIRDRLATRAVPALAQRGLGRVVSKERLEVLALELVVAVGLLARHLVLAPGDDELLQAQLVLGRLQHGFLHCVRRGEPEDEHRLLLADAVAAVLRLQVGVRVPVRVEDDTRVCRHQVDAQPSRAGGEEEDVRLALVELVHRLEAISGSDAPVKSPRGEPAHLAVVLEDVEHLRHLGEDEHLVAALLAQLGHDAVEEDHLATAGDDAFVHDLLPALVRGPLEEEGVVAALAQLHEDVVQADPTRGGHELPVEDLNVLVPLHLRGVAVEHVLELGRDRQVHVCLETPQQEGLEDEVELGHHLALLLLLQDLGLATVVGHVKVEPLLEALEIVEDVRQEEVEQAPQFREIVLQGRA
mmetsp:Transcript_13247/g.35347  ORF Transcript_13247/g.35347 Transcript_13247/m.35347 type:complete len:371 (-) Transcript_13247:1139-2251(-)